MPLGARLRREAIGVLSMHGSEAIMLNVHLQFGIV